MPLILLLLFLLENSTSRKSYLVKTRDGKTHLVFVGNPKGYLDGNPKDYFEGNPKDYIVGNPKDYIDGNRKDTEGNTTLPNGKYICLL